MKRMVGLLLAVAVIPSASLAATPARTVQSTDARKLVTRYFDALDSGRFKAACSLLGDELRGESGGSNCESFLAFGMPDPLVWKILGSVPARGGFGVRLRLGQNELDRVRMRTWLAIVRLEAGAPKIVETRLLH